MYASDCIIKDLQQTTKTKCLSDTFLICIKIEITHLFWYSVLNQFTVKSNWKLFVKNNFDWNHFDVSFYVLRSTGYIINDKIIKVVKKVHKKQTESFNLSINYFDTNKVDIIVHVGTENG